MLPIVFINCKSYPFISDIMSGKKLYETRTRNTLKSLVGKRVLIAETGHGKPVVKCLATIDHCVRVYDYPAWENAFRDKCSIERGSNYDWTDKTDRKYLYRLTDVQPVPEFIPPDGFRHGRTWMEYAGPVPVSDPEPAYMQYIADTYHCSDYWGEKITTEDMYINLVEWNKGKDPEDYCPHPSLAKQCADYWNHLCDLYPN